MNDRTAKELCGRLRFGDSTGDDHDAAADEIERLERENAELRHDIERAQANHAADINAVETSALYLPKITDEMRELLMGDAIMENTERGPQWTQTAVEFVSILAQLKPLRHAVEPSPVLDHAFRPRRVDPDTCATCGSSRESHRSAICRWPIDLTTRCVKPWGHDGEHERAAETPSDA